MGKIFSYGCIDDNLSMNTTVQEEPKQALTGGEETPAEELGEGGAEESAEHAGGGEYPIDPTTGLLVDVLKMGYCPENELGDTAPQPTDFTIEDIQESEPKNTVTG